MDLGYALFYMMKIYCEALVLAKLIDSAVGLVSLFIVAGVVVYGIRKMSVQGVRKGVCIQSKSRAPKE
mgnify:CR=1 FL=1